MNRSRCSGSSFILHPSSLFSGDAMAATILQAVKAALLAALGETFRQRVDEGEPPHDLKGQALPRLIVGDAAPASYSRTSGNVAETRTVRVEALARSGDAALALAAQAAAVLD